ncbi:autotransporter outer membrane beta-barrel domain-containing protein, partial [Salmonella enterica subsp. diarizonae serovar 48:i:z]|nr:autotransporter outer membrane beta-barrel domain-containing protein [Salmonella enterica subsp. diarizonae serovar 48:i:z]
MRLSRREFKMRKKLSKKKLRLMTLGGTILIGSNTSYCMETTISEGDTYTITAPVTINVTSGKGPIWFDTNIRNEYEGGVPITINLQNADHGMTTAVMGRDMDTLIFKDESAEVKYKHILKIISEVGEVLFNAHGTINNAYGNVIGSITPGANSLTEIVNEGEIGVIHGYPVKGILNYGKINGIGRTENLANVNGGIIRTDERGLDEVTKNLTNNGEIEIREEGLKIGGQTGSVLTNYGKIYSITGGPLIADDDGGSAIVNYGTITAVGENKHHFLPGTMLIDVADSAESELKNFGAISGEDIAIASTPRGKAGQLRITNEGTIEGDIVTTGADDGDTSRSTEISLNNNVGGVWAAGMKGWDLLGEKILYNKFKNVTNQGLIKTLNDSRPGRSTITAASFMNDGIIDVTAGGLTIIGDYTAGANSSLVTAAALMGDETELPTLVINGSVSGETTKVDVVNLGGTGAATVDGILVVRADTVDGEGFTKGERIVAGAYDYDLVKVQGDGYTEWRLTSELTPEPPGPTPPVPPGPTPPVPPGPTPP